VARRAQSNVVGVVLLVGITVVSLATLTAAVGTVVDTQTARADTARVADGLAASVRPVETTGTREGRITFLSGDLYTVERDLRVLDSGGVVAHRSVGALRFDGERGGATVVAGAVVRRGVDTALVRPPPVRAAEGLLAVNAVRLRGNVSVAATGQTTATVRTTVTHRRTALGTGRFRVAIETTTPGPVAAHYRERGRAVERRDLDGDGVPSVVVQYPPGLDAVLVTHDTEVEVDV
jgi:flagellin-like protein